MSGRDERSDFYVEELEELELDATPAPAPTAEERRRLAAQLAAEAKAKRPITRSRTAMEIIAEVMAAEEAEKQKEIDDRRRAAEEAKARAEAEKRQAEQEAREAEEAAEQAKRDRERFASMGKGGPRKAARAPRDLVPKGSNRSVRSDLTDPMGRMAAEAKAEGLLDDLGLDTEVIDLYVDIPPAVVGPLWQAHLVRAQHEGDLALAWMVHRVRDVVTGRPSDVVAARVQYGDREWAAWFDLDDEVVLALLAPADIYLVGLD